MNAIAVHVEGLSKQYRIGGPQKSYDRLSDQVFDLFTAPVRRASRLLSGKGTNSPELDVKIWALKDVSFEIEHGEVVGVIGRNGAGKTTLLKVLSRITEPTEGYADLYGRVGSLIEVGTGFHPELTGRENVFLNGAILGMTKPEIESKFDEILAFAELEKFVDTPVKHYSSGMYVRLAFSVAAHLEPEILLVDEVLAVGDIEFQRKCLGRMDDVAKEGRTVLFVSHNMGLIQSLCQRGILLEDGSIAADGKIIEVIDAYLQGIESVESQNLEERTDRKGQGEVKLIGLEIQSGRGGSPLALKTGEPARFIFHVDRDVPGVVCVFGIYDFLGQPIAIFRSDIRGPEDTYQAEHGQSYVCELDELLLLPGRYRMDVSIIANRWLQDYLEAAAFFDVGEGLVCGRPPHVGKDKRFRVGMPHRWTLPTDS